MRRNTTTIKGILAIFAIFMILCLSYLIGEKLDSAKQDVAINAEGKPILEKISELELIIDQQAKVDTQLLNELNSGQYTFNEPLVVVDPYHISPLTAVVIFKTEIPVQVSVQILGKTQEVDLTKTFSSFNTLHTIPILGLYAATENQITLSIKDTQGNRSEKSITVVTDELLPDLKANVLNVFQANKNYSPGFNFTYSNGNYSQYKCAFDQQGNYRWYLSKAFNTVSNYHNSDSLFLTYSSGNDQLIIETNYLGKFFNVYYAPYEIHHDIEVIDTSFLITGSDNSPNTIEDFIFEMDRSTGQISRTLDYRKILLRSRSFGVRYSNQDWLHMNSIVEHQNGVIISANFQSTVLCNDWQGNIKWMLADPSGYPEKYKQYLLKPIGSDFLYTYNQHAVEVLPDYDNNPDTVDIILFDNGTSRNAVDTELQRKIRANEIVEPKLFSRLVHYRINERKMTVEQIWQYGQSRPELFSAWRGDADLLPNGNIFGVFNIGISAEEPNSSAYVEVDSSGNLVWECWATSSNEQNIYQDYRVERLEMYTESSSDFKLGTPVNNFIPQDMRQKAYDLIKKADAS